MGRPDGYRYLKTHEWARVEGEFTYIGLSDYAIRHLSDLVFLDLPDVGQDIMQNEPVGEIESVKAVSDLNSPVAGEIIEVNPEIEDHLEILSDDPWNRGWLIKVKVSGDSASALVDLAAYEELVAEKE